MSSASKIGMAVVGGYVLGRTKKAKLAIMLGSALAGRKLNLSPSGLLSQGSKVVSASPSSASSPMPFAGDSSTPGSRPPSLPRATVSNP